MDNIAFVVVDNTARSFDLEYSYIIPDKLLTSAKVGVRVYVPFGRTNRKKEGLIVKIASGDTSNLKEIKEVIDDNPVVDKDMLDIIYKMKKQYICTYYDAISCVVPQFEKKAKAKTVKVAYLIANRQDVLDRISGNTIRSIWQIKILKYLLDNGSAQVGDIIKFIGGGRSSINTLHKNGLVAYREEQVTRDPYNKKDLTKDEPKQPTPDQSTVLDKIKGLLDKQKYSEVLIHGVTGSGKTEVYMHLVDYCIKKGKNAIVLVPEIALTPQMMDRFKARFGDNVAVIHSRLSQGERYDQWQLIRHGKVKVVVGVRSAIFAPLDHIGIIIIDEEHETSYKSETTPKYNAKDIAKLRCKKANAILVYGSATPSIETYYKALNGEINLCTMTNRANSNNLPKVELVDMRQELDDGNRSIFSYALKQEILKNIENGQQTMLFLNRRGHSTFVFCRSCGFAAKCVRCNVTMTYHKADDRLVCHYCGYTVKNFSVCPKCESKHIRSFGLGTQKVEEEVRKEFPNASVIRMDLDTTSYKNAHDEILTKFRDENINILIGTQMIAKGHDFPNVTLVGVLAADTMLNSSDFRSEERTFQLLTQVAGRAGRGNKAGKVIIQTYNMDAYSIQTAIRQDYNLYFNKEIKLREVLKYPPFSHIGVLTFSGINDNDTKEWANATKDFIQRLNLKHGLGLEVFGVNRATISKIKNRYRWKIILKGPNRLDILRVLTKVTDKFHKSKVKDIKLNVDIDPVNMTH